jgi:hypothetical protein
MRCTLLQGPRRAVARPHPPMPQEVPPPGLHDVLWADMQQAPRLQGMVRRIILGPVLATPLALRSVVRMLELYQPGWTDRVARSSTPYRSQRPVWPIT